MSRSHRKPVVTLTNQIDKNTAHKAVRRLINAELNKPEPDLTKLDADTRDIGAEEWGTKFGFIYVDPDDEDFKNLQNKMGRK